MTPSKRMLEVLADPDAVAVRAAEILSSVGKGRGTVGDPVSLGRVPTVILAGGSTPVQVFRTLVDAHSDFIKARADDADAEDVQAYGPPFLYSHVFWSDERRVPTDHARSNVGMARRELLNPFAFPEEQIHAPDGTADPAKAARVYERTIHRTFASIWEVQARIEDLVNASGSHSTTLAPDPDQCERFDLAMLGIGEDGHTASLFPGSEALNESRRWVLPVTQPGTGESRLTLTLPCLNRARHVLFVATGENKAEAVRRTLEPVPGETEPPAARIRPMSGSVLFLLDQAAAGKLSKRG